MVTQRIVLREYALHFRTVIPKFGIRLVSMNSENRAERSVLEPPDQQFVIRVGGVLIVRSKESPDVCSPVGHARHAETEARRNLPLKREPIAGDVTRPGCRRVSLLAGKS